MISPIFIDTNVPIYATGRSHPLREPCRRVLAVIREHPDSFLTGAEVLQELLHRYVALHSWGQGQAAFGAFTALMVGRIEALLPTDVEVAAQFADLLPGHSARDLVHFAVMRRVGADRVVTADRGFARLPGITRLDPAEVDLWGARLV